MKRLTLVFACALFFGATATFAQQDTTRSKSSQTQTQPQTQPQQQSDQLRNSDEMKGYTKVNSSEVPANLRQTLSSGNTYKGWDDATNGGVYRNAQGQYMVRTGMGTSAKTYYFDKDGKAISKPRGDH